MFSFLKKMVGDLFRQQGYHVTETGLGGADGGIDLLLTRGNKKSSCSANIGKRAGSAHPLSGKCSA